MKHGARKALSVWLEGHESDVRLALRTTLAALVSFALAHLLGLPQGYWAVMTAVLIMQASIGGSLKAGIDRFVGTFAGAIWGVAVTLAIPHREIGALALTLALALAPLALLAALRPNFRVAPVTAIIVLLSTTSLKEGTLLYALDRVLEIGLGCAIGLAVSLFILPERAHGLLADAAAAVLRDLAGLVELLLGDLAAPVDRAALAALHRRLRRDTMRVETLVDETKRERAHRLSNTPDPEPVGRNLRRLNHDLTAIGRAVMEPMSAKGRNHLADPVALLRRVLADVLTGAAEAFGSGTAPPTLESVDRALAAFGAEVVAMRESGAMREQGVDAVAQIYGLSFALQQLRGDLGDLADRIAERATAGSRS